MKLELPFEAFFKVDHRPAGFRNLLLTALEQKTALSARIGAADVIVEAVPGIDDIELTGQWRMPGLAGTGNETTATKLLLPLLFRYWQICLPHGQIYTMGRDHRSIADFFVRNLFYAMARSSPVSFVEVVADEISATAAGDFRRQYFYLVKATFAERAFEKNTVADAMDLLAANVYLPVLAFDSALLQNGGRAIRDAAAGDGTEMLKRSLAAARRAVLPHFGV